MGPFILGMFLSPVGGDLGAVSGEGLIEYSSAFQVGSLRVMVSADWSAPGPEVIGQVSWSGGSHGVTCLVSMPSWASMLSLGRKGQGVYTASPGL